MVKEGWRLLPEQRQSWVSNDESKNKNRGTMFKERQPSAAALELPSQNAAIFRTVRALQLSV